MTTPSTVYDVIIIGGGPACYTAGIYTGRHLLRTLILEGDLSCGHIPGGQLMYTTEVENYPGFESISGSDLMDRFRAQSVKCGAEIVGKSVMRVDWSRSDCPHFKVWVNDETDPYLAKSVIMATGASAKKLGLPNEEQFMNMGISMCATCDGALPRYRGAPVAVVGGGDSAMEEAMFLSRYASVVYLIHRRDTFRASGTMVKRVLENKKISVLYNTEVVDVVGDQKNGLTAIQLKTKDNSELKLVSGLFYAIGHTPNSGLLDEEMLDDHGYIKVIPGSTKTNIPGMFAAGDVMDSVYRQVATSVGSGCQAGIDATRYLE